MRQVRITDIGYRAPGSPEDDRLIEFIISTSAKDSHGTILNQRAWDLTRYARNGIVGYQHHVWGSALCEAPNPDYVLGPGAAWVEDVTRDHLQDAQLVGQWHAEPREINPLAEKIFQKVLFGTLKATSVGFFEVGEGRWGEGDEARGEANATYYLGGQQLAEWSIVNMGSNPETVKRSVEADTRAAIAFIQSRVPDLTTRDILKMTVRDILEELEGRPERAAFTSTTEREARRPLAEFVQHSLDTGGVLREAFRRNLS